MIKDLSKELSKRLDQINIKDNSDIIRIRQKLLKS